MKTHRIGSNVPPLKQHPPPSYTHWQPVLEAKALRHPGLSPGVHASLRIRRIGIHRRMVRCVRHRIPRIGMDQVANEVELVSNEVFGAGALCRIVEVHGARADLHMTIVMRIQITIHDHQPSLLVWDYDTVLVSGALGTPRHGIALLVEPPSVGFVDV